MDESTIATIAAGVLIFAFYIPFIVVLNKRAQYKYARRKFCKGIISILNNCPTNTTSCVDQIFVLHKRLAERYGNLNEYFRSASEMLEDLVVTMDTTDNKFYKQYFRINPPMELRNRIIEIYNIVKNIQPFSSISSKQGNLLNMLKHAIDIKNNELALNSLSQLSDEIEVLEGNSRKQATKNRLAFMVSIIGVVLTLFFGTISFLQFILK